jgi:hypothetical protein
MGHGEFKTVDLDADPSTGDRLISERNIDMRLYTAGVSIGDSPTKAKLATAATRGCGTEHKSATALSGYHPYSSRPAANE